MDTLLVTDKLFKSADYQLRAKYVRLIESVKDHGGKVRPEFPSRFLFDIASNPSVNAMQCNAMQESSNHHDNASSSPLLDVCF